MILFCDFVLLYGVVLCWYRFLEVVRGYFRWISQGWIDGWIGEMGGGVRYIGGNGWADSGGQGGNVILDGSRVK